MTFHHQSQEGNGPQAHNPSNPSELDAFWDSFDRDISPLSDIFRDDQPHTAFDHNITGPGELFADDHQDRDILPFSYALGDNQAGNVFDQNIANPEGHVADGHDNDGTITDYILQDIPGLNDDTFPPNYINTTINHNTTIPQSHIANTQQDIHINNEFGDTSGHSSVQNVFGNSPEKPKTRIHTKKVKVIVPQLPIEPDNRPQPIGSPSIWAEMRQELCDAFPFFRSHQSGLYYHNNVARGVLLDSVASDRDFCGDRVIITHSGGKSTQNAETGIRALAEDQRMDDSRIRALHNNLACKFPLAVIVGNKCSSIQTRVPHRYNVLDWFKVTHSWAERDSHSGLIRWKFRYEKLNFGSTGWWARTEAMPNNLKIVEDICRACGQNSPLIYRNSFICFNTRCQCFFRLRDLGFQDAGAVKLEYTDEFLDAETPGWEAFSDPPADLNPKTFSLPVLNGKVDLDFASRKAWKGWCCAKCGRLNCRNFWDRWQCANASCGEVFTANVIRIFTPIDLANDHRPLYTGYAIIEDEFAPEISVNRSARDGYTIMTYDLPRGGRVTHMAANLSANAKPGGADWLLRQYQTAGIPFQRYLMNVGGTHSYTAHYTHNVGARYKYVADQPTVTFEEAHPVVRAACDLLKNRVGWMHPGTNFNEILSVGYLEEQAMNYHQDGERGLGPTVASISLGCPAEMSFRVKKTTNSKASKPCLKLMLHHGDVMIMHGADIQRVYEHAAKPLGKFRIAATARWIDTDEHLGTLKRTKKLKLTLPIPKTELPSIVPSATMSPLSPAAAVRAHFRMDMDWNAPTIVADVPEAPPMVPVSGWSHYDPQNPEEE
ncbi:hypothetical protein BZA77DRAFT_366057 [Pyronema omphalodes]|nr:hypothetical protein BZA77DRAFT_366057 [Pyronema omphalodes]